MNIIPGAWNYTVGMLPGAPQASYLPTPDWSKDLCTTETPEDRAASRGMAALGVGAGSLLLGVPGIRNGLSMIGNGFRGGGAFLGGGNGTAVRTLSPSLRLIVGGTLESGVAASPIPGSAAAAGRMFSTGNPADGACPQGGTYVLRDQATGQVMRSGRSKNLAQRQKDHARDPALRDLMFEEVHLTNIYAEQRGLEQSLHETFKPLLNYINGISPRYPKLPEYRDAARKFLERQQGPSLK